MTFDVELLGDCDVIITELCQRLGGAWNNLLEGVEIPDVERRPLSRNEENATGEMHQGVNFEEIQRSEQVHTECDRTLIRMLFESSSILNLRSIVYSKCVKIL